MTHKRVKLFCNSKESLVIFVGYQIFLLISDSNQKKGFMYSFHFDVMFVVLDRLPRL